MAAAIAWASLSGSPFMQSIPWIPDSIARWADQNPNFRNFPAFGLLALALFTAAYFLNAGERLRFGRRGDLSTSPAADSGSTFRPQASEDLRSQVSALRPPFRPIRTALICTLLTILLAALFELLQLVLPHRSADWRDILWSALGALTATLLPAFILKLLRRDRNMDKWQ